MLTRWDLYVLDYSREARISRIMNLIVSHQSLLNARVGLLLFIEQRHHGLLGCALFFSDTKLISLWQGESDGKAREREEYNRKMQEKNKTASVRTTSQCDNEKNAEEEEDEHVSHKLETFIRSQWLVVIVFIRHRHIIAHLLIEAAAFITRAVCVLAGLKIQTNSKDFFHHFWWTEWWTWDVMRFGLCVCCDDFLLQFRPGDHIWFKSKTWCAKSLCCYRACPFLLLGSFSLCHHVWCQCSCLLVVSCCTPVAGCLLRHDLGHFLFVVFTCIY